VPPAGIRAVGSHALGQCAGIEPSGEIARTRDLGALGGERGGTQDALVLGQVFEEARDLGGVRVPLRDQLRASAAHGQARAQVQVLLEPRVGPAAHDHGRAPGQRGEPEHEQQDEAAGASHRRPL
jgi:hypothetical protein